MINKLKIAFLFCMITVVSLGCIESQKPPFQNETTTPGISTPVAYNETKSLKINGTFETWSRGYYSNVTLENLSFRIINNYSDWTGFLDNNRLEGELFPGIGKGMKPKTIEPADFNEYFIIAAMMGAISITGPEIEITNISIIKNTVNVTVRLYKPNGRLQAGSSPYHIVIVKRELLPMGISTFVFMDTEGKLLGKVEVNEYKGNNNRMNTRQVG